MFPAQWNTNVVQQRRDRSSLYGLIVGLAILLMTGAIVNAFACASLPKAGTANVGWQVTPPESPAEQSKLRPPAPP